MKIKIKRIDDAFKLEATNERGNFIHIDGSPAIGGSNSAFRPMEMLLVSVAGCSAIDVINIMNKQRQTISDFQMEISGEKFEGGTSSPYKSIDVHFIIKGDIKEQKLNKAMGLTKDKYCSVLHTLRKDCNVNFHFTLI
ncbi:MAG: OsmC family protein [Saprospiraceae bacterium]